MRMQHWVIVNITSAACALLALLCWSPAMALTAEVVNRSEGPALLVNGRRTAPLIVFINLTGDKPEAGLSTVRRAAAAGVNIVSFVCHHFPWPRPGEQADYSAWDTQVDAILQANPNALLIPRIGMSNVPGWWAQQNPDEMMLYDNGERGMVGVASEKWRRESAEMLRLLVRHLEEKYGEHMLGYHPCGQNTGEWFYDRVWENLLPGFESPMAAAFHRWLNYRWDDTLSPEERRAKGVRGFLLDPASAKQQWISRFCAFQQDVMVEPLERFARVIKHETKGRKLVVYFYGYTFELSALPGGPAVSGHLALERLLRCKDVDIVCSPISYSDRQPGGAGMFMAPVDSVQLHGKLWLNEDDTRTYLSSPQDGYGRAGTLGETLAVHDRNFAHISSRGAACWWMDLPGSGWLDSDEIWANCARGKRLYEALNREPKAYRPEIAVVVDEKSLFHLAYGNQVSNPLLYQLRLELYRIGAPVGFYLLSDVCAGKVTWPKIYIFLNAFALSQEERQALLRQVRRPGKTALWFYAPGYIQEREAHPRLSVSLIGINIKQKIAPFKARARLIAEGQRFLPGLPEGLEFGDGRELDPLFEATDPTAAPVARYDAGGVAVAAKSRDGWTSIFVGPLHAPAAFLRAVAKKAGAHVYMDSNDIVAAGNGILAVHATSAGEKALRLPPPCTLKDAFSGAVVLKKGAEIRFRMTLGETRIFLRQPDH